MKRKGLLLITGLILGIIEILLGWSVLPENILGAFLIFIGLGYAIGGGFFLANGPGPLAGALTSSSDRTLLALAPGALVILLAVPLEYRFMPAILPRQRLMQWLGLAFICLGMAVRIWTRMALKKAYQGSLQVQPGQRLVTSGPYHWVRHPGYLGFILMAFGLVLGFSSLSGLLGLILLLGGFLRRIQQEEQLLIQAFGEQYMLYARNTGRLFPRLVRTAAQNNQEKKSHETKKCSDHRDFVPGGDAGGDVAPKETGCTACSGRKDRFRA